MLTSISKPQPFIKYNKNIKIDNLAIIDNQTVIIEGLSSYTSGDQLWKGAADTLNKNPTIVIIKPIVNPPLISEIKGSIFKFSSPSDEDNTFIKL